MLRSVCNAAFIAVFLASSSTAALLIKLTSLLPISKSSHETLCIFIVRSCWNFGLAFCPWVRLSRDPAGWEEWEALRQKVLARDAAVAVGEATHRPLFTIGNHASFLDTPLATCLTPHWVFMRSRTYLSGHLLKIPVLSTISIGMGHFPVFFASGETGKFRVDAEKMAPVEARAEKFLKGGGFLAMFPEGQVNKDPDTLLPFRHGGMKRALELDACLAFFVMYGNAKVWPRKAQLAGYPGTVRYGTKVVAPDGARAYVKALREAGLPEDERDLPDYALLAKRLQESMQEMYDKLKADVEGKSKKSD